ncbi:MAG TPA: hypothetical protein VKU84_13775, partial [Stellaceae bacterium]|nr:hypothetical protein [Stellaceae bacterium]
MAQGDQSEHSMGHHPPRWVLALAAGLLALRSRDRSARAPTPAAISHPVLDEPHPPLHEPGPDSAAARPGSGWKAFLLRLYEDISRHRLMTMAAGVTFFAVLAIFPAIAAIVAIYGLFADATT